MTQKNKGYDQLCVMEATTLDGHTTKEFEDFISNELKTRAKFAEVVTTLPDQNLNGKVPGTGGRKDLLFFIHKDDITSIFATKRFQYAIRWWEDCNLSIYPKSIRNKYPKTW